jgi:hypothetical protein
MYAIALPLSLSPLPPSLIPFLMAVLACRLTPVPVCCVWCGSDQMLVSSNDSSARLYRTKDFSLICKYAGYTSREFQVKATLRSVPLSSLYSDPFVPRLLAGFGGPRPLTARAAAMTEGTSSRALRTRMYFCGKRGRRSETRRVSTFNVRAALTSSLASASLSN